MPKLWNETISAHRRAVEEAILDTTAAVVLANGLASVTMSTIAEHAGIGRATLYKYFPDVEAILLAWHDRQVSRNLRHLARVRDGAAPDQRIQAVLEAYAGTVRERHDTELAAFLHEGERVARAQRQLHDFVRDLLVEGVTAGELRDDATPDELAGFCLAALTAAGGLPSKIAIQRLVAIIMSGLRPPIGASLDDALTR